MEQVRQPAVAGVFYPGDAGELNAAVTYYLSLAPAPEAANEPPKALIVPHAGYIYSAPIAASAYTRLKPISRTVKRVVLLGPSHRVSLRGLALSAATAFATPLGDVPVDRDAVQKISGLPQVQILDAPHDQEHSLEIHLPFLQVLLEDFSIVPLVVGEATPEDVAQVIERLWGGPETLIVISSDLSHYLDYDSARTLDAETCQTVEVLDAGAIRREQACGRIPMSGLMALAKRKGMRVETLDLRNSGDTAGDKSRVVGYGAWVFVENRTGNDQNEKGNSGDFTDHTRALLEEHGETLLRIAAASIDHGLTHGTALAPANAPQALLDNGACFVTLKHQGKLRGCIGTVEAYRPLIEDVAENAFSSAFRDPRFPPLREEERAGLSLSISVLSPSHPMTFTDEESLLKQLSPGTDGLIIEDQGRRALFLPSVWESLPEPAAFMANLKRKAGMAVNHWSDTFKAERFITTEVKSDSLSNPASLWSGD